MRQSGFVALTLMALTLAGCGTRAVSSVAPTPGATPSAALPTPAQARKSPADVTLTEGDITDRPYQSLGDIKVTVAKWTIFDKDPTQEAVGQALREKAAEMGADAVILVRYGSVGIGFTSWGQMDGQGRAIVFAH